MLWLASYPRSGNTFLRIVLDEVYGIESSTFHDEASYPVDENYADYTVVKTHLLPHQLLPTDPSIPAVYLVRDGRDCLVSLAHYRRQLIAPDSDLFDNQREAIDAADGSHFGGWSEHVRQWLQRANVVIRFEDLISDPIDCLEQLRPWLDLPAPRVDRLPRFDDLKARDFKYGTGSEHGFDAKERKHWRTAKFRRGRAGGWKDELPEQLHLRFLRRHGAELSRLGYFEVAEAEAETTEAPAPTRPPVVVKEVRTPRRAPQRSAKKRVLIDASKLLDKQFDGIRRYVVELLKSMLPLVQERQEEWEIDISFGVGENFPLLQVAEAIRQEEPLLSMVPPLLRPGNGNPLGRSAERLQELKGQFSWELVRESLRFHQLKTIRSLQKRMRSMRYGLARFRNSVGGLGRPESEYDLIHLTLPNTWMAYRHYRTPYLTTVHDLCHLACPQYQKSSNNRSLASGLEFAERVGSHYLAVSSSTGEQLQQFLGVDSQRVDVVHEGCGQQFMPGVSRAEMERVRGFYSIPEGPFILCVGTLEPRKNLVNTVRAFRRLEEDCPDIDANLVIAGSFGWGDAEQLRTAVESSARIHRTGYVADEHLPALYAASTAFCYASHYEGFGLPLLEAMSCGVPTIHGDVSSMPEVVGDGGLPVSPNDVAAISDCMKNLLNDEPLRAELGRRAVLRSLRFSWEKTAEATLDSYERCIERQHQQGDSNQANSASSSGRPSAPGAGGKRHAA